MNLLESSIVEHPFFRSMRSEHQSLLLENAQQIKYNAGDIIFREGELANRLFLIKTGKVNLMYHSNIVPAVKTETVGAGQVFGWSWLFPPFQWHFTAKATEPTCTIVLDGGHLLVASEKKS